MHDHLTPLTRFGGRSLSRLALLGGAFLVAGFVMSCAAAPEANETPTPVQETAEESAVGSEETQASPSNGSAGTATFTAGERVFTVELTFCGVYEQGTEILLAGIANEINGDAQGFLEGGLLPAGSALNGEFRIDIGADGPLQTSEEFLALGSPSGSPVTLSEEPEGYLILSGTWNEHGDSLGGGSLAFSCS